MSITVSSGITKFQMSNIINAMVHNHRLEESHRNIKNNNTNWKFNLHNQELQDILIYPDKVEQRKAKRAKAKRWWNTHLKKQFDLMSERNKSRGYNPPKKKDLKPIVEGVVNFGNVYDVTNDSNEERIRKTNEFHNSYSEEEWQEIFNQIKDNLLEFCKQTGTELLDITFHRDEEGLYHIHYLITNYNNVTGESMNVRQNKNGIGYLLQDIVSSNLEEYNMTRVKKGKKGRKTLTKEQLIENRTSKEKELKELDRKIEKADKELIEFKDDTMEIKREMYLLFEQSKIDFIAYKNLIIALSQIDPSDKYGTKKNIDKVLKTADYLLSKGKIEVAIERFNKIENLVSAMDKTHGTDLSSILKDNNTPNNPI